MLEVYNHAVVTVFYALLGFACATLLAALPMQWKSVKKGPKRNEDNNERKQEETQGDTHDEDIKNGDQEKVHRNSHSHETAN